MDEGELRARIMPGEPDEEKRARHARVYELCVQVLLDLNAVVPDGREKALMVTHMEEVCVWANKAVARD